MVIAHHVNQLTPMLAAEARVSMVRIGGDGEEQEVGAPEDARERVPARSRGRASCGGAFQSGDQPRRGRISWTARKAWSMAASVYE